MTSPYPRTKFFLFDGYSFGDRLLEGIKFKACIDDGETTVLSVSVFNLRDLDYFNQLNKKLWLRKAKEHAQCELDECKEELDILYEPN